jgi:hypothetical protein
MIDINYELAALATIAATDPATLAAVNHLLLRVEIEQADARCDFVTSADLQNQLAALG